VTGEGGPRDRPAPRPRPALSPRLRAELAEIYARDLQKWLLIAPLVGALTGLLVTTFAFLGVNMFLSGLHSYGKL
jgi:hypothetical protein